METKNSYTNFVKLFKTEDGDIPFLKDVWGFFSSKGVKTIFISINSDKSFRLDLEICENLGCPIRMFTNEESIEEKWSIISKTLKARKIDEVDKEKEWLEGIQKKWILPKNLLVKRTSLDWNTFRSELQIQNQGDNRMDILKIESKSEEERILLYSMLDSGYRPGILLVKYTEDPDSSVPSMLIAGHLQMSGYRLIEAKDNWFCYLYTDICFYDSCSWRNTSVQNPLIKYVVELFNTKKEDSVQVQQQEKEQEQENKTPEEQKNPTA